MATLLNLVSALGRAALSLFEGTHPLVSLAPISLLAGVAMLWVFGRVSNQEAIRRAKARLQAHLYELRLFADEPALIFRAQRDLLVGNARYLALMLGPAVILTIPMIPLLVQLDLFYGRAPLATGEATLVAVRMKEPAGAAAPLLEAPPGFAVESPAVRVTAGREIVWRIRALRETAGKLRVIFPNATLDKEVRSGKAPRYLSARRVSSLAGLILEPAEKPIPPDGNVDWIEVRYPPAEVGVWGLNFHWLVWFLAISLAGAWFLKGRLGVSL